MRLFDNHVSGNCYKARLLLAQLELDYERIEIDLQAPRPQEFLTKSPNGRVPLLELDDGRVLGESGAILCYLAEGTPYLPDDRYERAEVLQWLFYEQYSHEPYVAVARAWIHFGLSEGREQELAERQERGAQELARMESHLEANEFFAAGRYTIADIALYAYTHVAPEGGIPIEPYPAIGRWLERVAAQPGHVPITA